jgi:hypothetical protein
MSKDLRNEIMGAFGFCADNSKGVPKARDIFRQLGSIFRQNEGREGINSVKPPKAPSQTAA